MTHSLQVSSTFGSWLLRMFGNMMVVTSRILKRRTWIVLKLLLSKFDKSLIKELFVVGSIQT